MARVSGTREWAKHSLNIQGTCGNGCLYCYASANPLPTKPVPEKYGERSGTTMFPTRHDITEENVDEAVITLKKLLAPGNSVLIVSKPRLSVIKRLLVELKPWQEQVLFRFTIGSLREDTLRFWEPEAPPVFERMASLVLAHTEGWDTSVSVEPMLDTLKDDIVALVRTLEPFVTDAIWLGKANKLVERLKANGHWCNRSEVRDEALQVIVAQQDEYILALYESLKGHPKVRWKESIKEVVGLELGDVGEDR